MARSQNFPERASGSDRQAELAKAGLHLRPQLVDSFENLVFESLPSNSYAPFYWRCDNDDPVAAYLCFESVDGQVHSATGLRSDSGQIVIHAAYLAFGRGIQNAGHGRKMARNMLAAAKLLPASRVEALANLDIGSYAWARMRARPKWPDKVALELFRRIDALQSRGIWPKAAADMARGCLQEPLSPDFMSELADLPAFSGVSDSLGKDLLTDRLLGPFAWEAYWDLKDSSHIHAVTEALNGP